MKIKMSEKEAKKEAVKIKKLADKYHLSRKKKK